jgi:hypothetical protein
MLCNVAMAIFGGYVESGLNTARVSASVLLPPGTLFARKAGMNFMVDLTDLKFGIPRIDDHRAALIDSKEPQLVTRALRAIVRGVHLFKTRKRRYHAHLRKFLGTKDPEGLTRVVGYAAKMPAKPYAVESAVQAVLDHLAESQPKYGQYKPAELLTHAS